MVRTQINRWHRMGSAMVLALVMACGFAQAEPIVAPVPTSSTGLPRPSSEFTRQEFPYVNPSNTGSATSGTGISSGLNAVKTTLPQGIQREESASRLVLEYVNYFMGFYPYVAIGLIIYFGVRLIISRGDAEARKEALSGIINIAIGTLLIYMAYGIVAFILTLTSPATAEQALQM